MTPATYLRSLAPLVFDVIGFCAAKAKPGSRAAGGGTGPADLRGRRLAGKRDQGGAVDSRSKAKDGEEEVESVIEPTNLKEHKYKNNYRSDQTVILKPI